MKNFLVIVFLIFSVSSFATERLLLTSITEIEIGLDSTFKALRKSTDNKDFISYNKEFKIKLKQALTHSDAFTHPFDSLNGSMSTITSPDKKFRLFNWNVESEEGIHSFHCFILRKDGNIIELRDAHRNITQPELKSLSNRKWYGALYYKIIPIGKGKYTLLGWNGKNTITTQKVIETMSISRRSAKFGFALFEKPNERAKKKRIILEYSDEAYVSLKLFETKKSKEIVFSHLSPRTPQMEGIFQYYYPDLSFDKYEWENGKWMFKSDVLIKDGAIDGNKNYNAPE